MLGDSGLNRAQLRDVGRVVQETVHECGSNDTGVREEQFREHLGIQVDSGAMSQDDAERALYARRDSVLPPGMSKIPVAERGKPIGGIALGEPLF